MWILFEFVEHPIFTQQIRAICGDDAYAAFQKDLAADPETGDVMPGLGGLRKVRMAAKGKGKRGGARVIYLHLSGRRIIFLFYVYTKGRVEDLNAGQKKRLREAVESIKKQYA